MAWSSPLLYLIKHETLVCTVISCQWWRTWRYYDIITVNTPDQRQQMSCLVGTKPVSPVIFIFPKYLSATIESNGISIRFQNSRADQHWEWIRLKSKVAVVNGNITYKYETNCRWKNVFINTKLIYWQSLVVKWKFMFMFTFTFNELWLIR